ncbi:MAG: tetratricopeptide repeat protein [Cyanobacteria bacterium HKST-UBA02]|nr:tetratricopeptide repeat protein [Cyanobacteria bacterium HKST-UBA02]
MNEEKWAEFYNNACQSMRDRDFESAEVHWRRAWREVRDLDHLDPRYLMTLEYFADILCQKRKFQEAEGLLTELLEIKTSLMGGHHIRVGTTHNTLAGLYFALNDYPKAEEHCRKALDIHLKLLGEQNEDVVAIMQNLAMVCHAQQKYDDAEPLYVKALDAAQKVYGAEHPGVADIAEHYAGLMDATGRTVESNECKKTLVLPIYERLVRTVGADEQRITNKGFPGATLTGIKRDPRRSSQCLYRIKPLPPPDEKNGGG